MEAASDEERVGLCLRCQNVRVQRSPRGSTFYLCTLSFRDPGFVKYPRLPVLSCPGFRLHERSDDAHDVREVR